MTVAELAYEQIKTLPEAQARELLDFIGYLKHKGVLAQQDSALSDGTDDEWDEFEKLAGAWSGQFDREACYDRPILR
ncbi:MAG: DUF2281 domain-containing protein [Lamprocystis purpurea]|jgi:hypothetical protein|uniref:DUF2281 domain-containing protein n=1 Tax=Lamprocystis purpurea TaxID=61598 RepID=UPI00036247DD|nr:DUF2281 domain-containing protein [Lamprocystis purpurea]MBV5274524.1 DUF2281 domain-containing protein [Lamprocystis purpurea]